MDQSVIASSQNPKVKHLVALSGSTKARREAGETLLEGVHVVEDGFRSTAEIRQLIIAESSLTNGEVKSIIAGKPEEAELLIVSDARFKSFSSVEHGIGVAAIMKIPAQPERIVLDGDALLLDGVQDPGNVGTLLRTAAASGVKKVFTSADTASLWAPKVLRAGMGAQFSLELHEGVDLASLVQKAVVPVYATLLNSEATSLYSLELAGTQAWLLGSEGQGVRDELVQAGAKPVFIPQTDGVESLNVAAAAAVCLFEQRRQRL